MKEKLVLLIIGLLFISCLSGCIKSSHYVRQTQKNVATTFFDGDASSLYMRGD